MITENEVLTRIANSVDALSLNCYLTSVYEPFPPKLPCVYVRQTDKYPLRNRVDLDYTDAQNVAVFTAEVYTQKSDGNAKATADLVMDTIADSFRQMYFIMQMRTPVDNGDPSVYRILARFRRVICNGDELPALPTPEPTPTPTPDPEPTPEPGDDDTEEQEDNTP